MRTVWDPQGLAFISDKSPMESYGNAPASPTPRGGSSGFRFYEQYCLLLGVLFGGKIIVHMEDWFSGQAEYHITLCCLYWLKVNLYVIK